jgi:hypothetical protein
MASMAEEAGAVNDRGRDNDDDFRQMIQPRSEEVQALALRTRDLVYDVFPDTVEVIWHRQGSVGWGIGPKKFSEQFSYFMPYARHVTLGFYRGGDLPDPEGLLPRSGARQVSGKLSMRSIKITDPAQLDDPALRTLIEAAVEERSAR